MSNLKRKDAPGGSPPAKSAKKAKEGKPNKDDTPRKTSKATTTASSDRSKAPLVSILKDEEPMFPRGGGSVLTPLEQKQIQLDAKADAKREEEFDDGSKALKKKKRKSALKAKESIAKIEEDDGVKVESLNFKKLVTGSLVLGQISKINNLNVEVSLPNNLTGHVSIVAISEQMTARVEQAADNEDEDAEDTSDDNDVDLKKIFVIGQYVRTHVVSTMDDSGSGKKKHKIDLSLRPSDTNAGLEKNDIVPHSTLMAAVVSVEDRGCVMDIGVSGVRAFLPRSAIDSGLDYDRLQPGNVFLCEATNDGSSGKVVQLALRQKSLGNVNHIPEATTINTYLPGTAVEVLVTNTDRRGLAGKIMGHVDATADVVHSGVGPLGVSLDSTYKIGSKVKARIICNFPLAKDPKLGVSLLPHITSLSPKIAESSESPLDVLPISSFVEKCTVRHVEAEIGLFVELGESGLRGFVHISRVKDGKIDALFSTSGPFKVDSVHKGRIIGFNSLDGIFQVSFEKSVLDRPYIRLEDVPVGAVVSAPIERMIINEEGVGGLILNITEGISGLVTERHLSDIRLQHPEKKFREGMKVKARVLSVNPFKKQMRLTMKKTLVNSEAPIISSYEDVNVGMQVLGTIISLQAKGAHIQFYGSLRGFLPVSEMSEAYIRDPAEHFRIGQVVNVHVLDVEADQRRLVVSCKDPTAFGLDKQTALKSLQVGGFVNAKVTQKTEDQVLLELQDSQLKAILPVGHLTDKSASKNQYALKRIAVGQTISDLLILEKDERRRAIILSQKSSLIDAAKQKKLLTSFEDAKEGALFAGFVRNITPTAVFIQFANGLHALLPKARLQRDVQSQADFGMHKYQSIEVKVISTIQEMRRILVAPASAPDEAPKMAKASAQSAPSDDLSYGSLTEATITSIKETQLNVRFKDSQVQGRLDISQIFDSWDDIADPKEPLKNFQRKQTLNVRVIGVHDAKDHRFLPISHRSTHSILELTAKQKDLKADTLKTLSLADIKPGDNYIAFVNNVSPQFLWVNLSPVVRGRISAMEASDDLSQLNDLEGNFPVGSALKVRVTAVDASKNRLDLSARSAAKSNAVTWKSLKPNMILAGRVIKVGDRQIVVNLGEAVSGVVNLTDFADNYDEVNTANYKNGDIVRVSVVEIDASNKKIRLSTRPSRIMSSTLEVKDKEITDVKQLSSGDIVRGFVKNVSDKGLFVLLGGQVSALVKIANLSDRFLKEWKDQFQVDQLVKGRVLSVDFATKQVELGLKSSMVDENYVPLLTMKDLQEGQIVTGQVRKVEEYGAFVLLDNSSNVSGLCHRSQMADKAVKDATKLYKEGDRVKAIVLEINTEKKRVSLGLKPSLFDDEDSEMDSNESDNGVEVSDAEDDGDDDGDDDDDVEMGQAGVSLELEGEYDDSDSEADEDDDGEEDDEDVEMEDVPHRGRNGLGIGKKSTWSTDPFADDEPAEASNGDKPTAQGANKKKTSQLQVDRTAELDVNGPQTSSDYERLLLGQPDSSELWIAYMAFQMQVSELSKAREVAERAIKSIGIREEAEKLNVWVAYLNLEVAYGNPQTVEEVFKRACQYNDAQEVHERLASIYIQSEKPKDADSLFETMLKKFGSKSPNVWLNYAHFLYFTLGDAPRARALLPRATQQLDSRHQTNIISRFAAFEFRAPSGDAERGRTMFEGLLATWPKKGDLWAQLLDLETAAGPEADPTAVRDVFERRIRIKGLKPLQAEKWFRRWAAWEEKMDPKGKEKVMAKAQDWTAAYKANREAASAAAQDPDME